MAGGGRTQIRIRKKTQVNDAQIAMLDFVCQLAFNYSVIEDTFGVECAYRHDPE
jgi:hypothetical protein